jgi:hypothetical protein
MTENELQAMVRLLQAATPLRQISNMEARVVFEYLEQLGYRIIPPADTRACLEGA